MSGQLNWIVRISTEVEMSMNAVERVLEYTDLPPETTDKHEESESVCVKMLTKTGKRVINSVCESTDRLEESKPL